LKLRQRKVKDLITFDATAPGRSTPDGPRSASSIAASHRLEEDALEER
jgi:hypothetical protein